MPCTMWKCIRLIARYTRGNLSCPTVDKRSTSSDVSYLDYLCRMQIDQIEVHELFQTGSITTVSCQLIEPTENDPY